MESCKRLSSADAQQRLTQYGPNAAVEEKTEDLATLFAQILGVGALEAGNYAGAGGTAREVDGSRHHHPPVDLQWHVGLQSGAQSGVDLLKERLRIQARVYRDGQWQRRAMADLVPVIWFMCGAVT